MSSDDRDSVGRARRPVGGSRPGLVGQSRCRASTSLGMALTMYAEVGLGDGPPGSLLVDDHHPADDRFRPTGRHRHAVGALADPDGTRARLQRSRTGRGRSGSGRAAGRAGVARIRRHRRRDARRRRATSRAMPTTSPPRCWVASWRRRAGVRSGCRSAFIPLVVVWIPAGSTSTDHSRKQLPATVSRDDAVFNIGRVAMFVAALRHGDTGALRERHRAIACTRSCASPMRRCRRRALDAGARARCLGGWLTGSGPTIALLCKADAAAGLAASLPDDGHSRCCGSTTTVSWPSSRRRRAHDGAADVDREGPPPRALDDVDLIGVLVEMAARHSASSICWRPSGRPASAAGGAATGSAWPAEPYTATSTRRARSMIQVMLPQTCLAPRATRSASTRRWRATAPSSADKPIADEGGLLEPLLGRRGRDIFASSASGSPMDRPSSPAWRRDAATSYDALSATPAHGHWATPDLGGGCTAPRRVTATYDRRQPNRAAPQRQRRQDRVDDERGHRPRRQRPEVDAGA